METFQNSFMELVNAPQWSQEYIGQGNPNAKILIISKEHGFDEKTNQKDLEITRNHEQWREVLHNPNYQEDGYSPLTCYLGRKQKFNMKECHSTWFAIQKLMNLLYDTKVQKGDINNFFNYCFLTELSMACRKNSGRWNEQTQESINQRLLHKDGILRHEFYQSFPIIILDCHRYIDIYGFNNQECNLETLFGRKFIKCQSVGKEFINIHKTEDKILLHTNHFAMRSNHFIEAVANCISQN